MNKVKVVVASENPVKKNAVSEGFLELFSSVEIQGVSVKSGVPDQPRSDEETKTGAQNRAYNAKQLIKNARFWVGIEGGIQKSDTGLTAFAWIVILSEDKYGEARTTTFLLPQKVAVLISEGYELGAANDIVFNQENSKQKHGAVGLLTQNTISRTELYKQAVQLALIPFINPELF